MSTGTTLRCVAYKRLCRGSLRGFTSISFIVDGSPKFTLNGIGVNLHANGAAWAAPPSQAIIKNGQLVKDDTGKVQYGPPLLEFNNKQACQAWSDAVVRAVLAHDARAL